MTAAFDDQAEARIEALLGCYPSRQAALLPLLHLAQEEFGHLSDPVLELVARRLDLPPSKVLSVATFYTMFRRQPQGRHHIQLCSNLTCSLRGAESLRAHLEERLGIKVGETSADGRFTLSEVECLGACGSGPAMQVNDDYHERLDRAAVDRILEELD